MRLARISLSLVLLACIPALAPACSCGRGDTTAGGSAGGTGGVSSDAGQDVEDDAAGGGMGGTGGLLIDSGTSCPSHVICGDDGECCPEGTECVQGACVAACATGVRCGATGEVCCGANQICISSACTDPGAPCLDSYDCDEGQFCEPTIGACFPQPQGQQACEYRPPTLPFETVVEWSWTGSPILPAYDQVINMPVVVDLDKDGIPDVVIVTSDSYSSSEPAYLRALDGRTGTEKWAATADVYAPGNEVNPRGTPAAADLDGDGMVDIVAPRMGGGVIAFHGDGSLMWRSTRGDGVTPYVAAMNSVTVAIANMDHDGRPEIVVGGVVLDAQGKVISGEGRELAGTNATNYGAVSIIADVDGDGMQDVVSGRAAWKLDGTVIWDNGLSDGYPAIAQLDGQGPPELVVVSNGTVRVHNAQTGELLASLAMPAQGRGGPPTIADFDADGHLEIASANGGAYVVFEYEGHPHPALSVKWSTTTQDLSSNVTGSSVFDFEGDGAAEVVYADECFFRVYSGIDGSVLLEEPSSSATIHEYPVVVDVDGDNNTEVVVVSNDLNHYNGTTTCPGYAAIGATPRHGVFVYGDAHDKWVRTRRVWNQHAYHITNINSDGTVPDPEPESWVSPPGFNNYRVSTQGAGVYNAPDLQVDLEVSQVPCPASLELRARVKNAGSLGVPAGVAVSFYLGSDATGELLGNAATTKPLLPGQSEVVSFPFGLQGRTPPFQFFVAVDGGSATGTVNECVEDNNAASAGGVDCPGVK